MIRELIINLDIGSLEGLEAWLASEPRGEKQSSYLEGVSDGENGEGNRNIGSLCPCPYYQVGYYIGTRNYVLNCYGIYSNREDWELIVELSDTRYPLSSPAHYRIERISNEDGQPD